MDEVEDDREPTEEEIAEMVAAAPLKLTHAVEVFAAARGGREPLEALARTELGDLLRDGLPAPEDLIFHTFSWHGDYNIMLLPAEKGLRVDLCERELSEPLDAGPFAGRRASFPVPFSSDE